MRELTMQEIAAILAGLRMYQELLFLPRDIEDIATNGGEFEALGTSGIDSLCEAINLSSRVLVSE